MDTALVRSLLAHAAFRGYVVLDADGRVIERSRRAVELLAQFDEPSLAELLAPAVAQLRRIPDQVIGLEVATDDGLVSAQVRSAIRVQDGVVGFTVCLLPVLDAQAGSVDEMERTRWQYLLEHTDDALWDWDLVRDTVFFSSRWSALLGLDAYAGNELESNWRERIHPDDIRQLARSFEAHVSGRELAMNCVHRLRRDDGQYVWVQTRARIVRWNVDGAPTSMLGHTVDVSESVETNATLRWKSEMLDRIASMGRIGGYEYFFADNRLLWTEQNYAIHGLPDGSPISLPAVLQLYDPASRAWIERQVARLARHAGSDRSTDTAELALTTPAGVRRWIRSTGAIEMRNGEPYRLTGLAQDITEHKHAHERIAELAYTDLLTGLANRVAFRERAAAEIANGAASFGALLFLDLDRFTHVNETFGHSLGDGVLRECSARLCAAVGANDIVARTGGDEFSLLLRRVDDAGDVATFAARLLEHLREPMELDGVALRVTASIGIVLVDRPTNSIDDLLRAADNAMHAAKDTGRNRFAFYDAAQLERVQQRMHIENLLHGALERSEFRLVYQATVALADGRQTGAEALLRWRDQTGQRRQPLDFVPIAEDSGHILPIGEWVLVEACRQARRWSDAGIVLRRIAVNVSAVQVREPGFALRVLSLCDQAGLPPERLELEITESVLMEENSTVRESFALLIAHRVSLAIDDFGTGFSNLRYLARFPVHRLKIDREFLQRFDTDSKAEQVVRGIIGLGHALGMQVVAEGVESAEDAQRLRVLRCDEAQGYFFGRPMAAPEFAASVDPRVFRKPGAGCELPIQASEPDLKRTREVAPSPGDLPLR